MKLYDVATPLGLVISITYSLTLHSNLCDGNVGIKRKTRISFKTLYGFFPLKTSFPIVVTMFVDRRIINIRPVPTCRSLGHVLSVLEPAGCLYIFYYTLSRAYVYVLVLSFNFIVFIFVVFVVYFPFPRLRPPLSRNTNGRVTDASGTCKRRRRHTGLRCCRARRRRASERANVRAVWVAGERGIVVPAERLCFARRSKIYANNVFRPRATEKPLSRLQFFILFFPFHLPYRVCRFIIVRFLWRKKITHSSLRV